MYSSKLFDILCFRSKFNTTPATWCLGRAAYARWMGQPTQRATNYTARSNIDTAQIFLHANGQRPKRALIRQRSRRRQRRGEPHTEHGLGVRLYRAARRHARAVAPIMSYIGIYDVYIYYHVLYFTCSILDRTSLEHQHDACDLAYTRYSFTCFCV